MLIFPSLKRLVWVGYNIELGVIKGDASACLRSADDYQERAFGGRQIRICNIEQLNEWQIKYAT